MRLLRDCKAKGRILIGPRALTGQWLVLRVGKRRRAADLRPSVGQVGRVPPGG